MIGKVHVWYMTPEELAEYVKKHPIVPTKNDYGSTFSSDSINYAVVNERKKEVLKGKKVMDTVDIDKLHKLFVSGETLEVIAKALNVNRSTLNNFITQQRNVDPVKWPYRTKK